MASVDDHIRAEARLRDYVRRLVEGAWVALPGHDRENVPQFLAAVVPSITAAQVFSARMTDAHVARSQRRRPTGVPRDRVSGPAIRKGTPPEVVYERPFTTLWTGLAGGATYTDAFGAATARLRATAAMDMQLSARAAFEAIEELEPSVFGYQRVADGDACEFCQEVDGAYVKAADGFAMALHNNCGCSLEPLDKPHRGAVNLPDGTAVRDHGELGPVLGSPDHDFTTEAQALA